MKTAEQLQETAKERQKFFATLEQGKTVLETLTPEAIMLIFLMLGAEALLIVDGAA
jgi:hypothetical protein